MPTKTFASISPRSCFVCLLMMFHLLNAIADADLCLRLTGDYSLKNGHGNWHFALLMRHCETISLANKNNEVPVEIRISQVRRRLPHCYCCVYWSTIHCSTCQHSPWRRNTVWWLSEEAFPAYALLSTPSALLTSSGLHGLCTMLICTCRTIHCPT